MEVASDIYYSEETPHQEPRKGSGVDAYLNSDIVHDSAPSYVTVYPDIENIYGPTVMSRDSTHTPSIVRILDDERTVVADKGYRLAKGSHGVADGTWYYEVEVLDMPEGSNARIGWAQLPADQQAPCGYDIFSYAYRASPGTYFHASRQVRVKPQVAPDARGVAARGYARAGAVIGVLIHLGTRSAAQRDTMAEWRWCGTGKYERVSRRETPLPRAAEGAHIRYYVDGRDCGIAFEGDEMALGQYYPGISVFGSSVVRVNMGPEFKHTPVTSECEYPGWHGMSEASEHTACVVLQERPRMLVQGAGVRAEDEERGGSNE